MSLRRLLQGALGMLSLFALSGTCENMPLETGFTKIANNGSELSPGALLGAGDQDWGCLRDDRTGLLWEVKTAHGKLRDRRWTYTPYDSNFSTNGGYPGFKDATSGECLREGMREASCNTEAYIQAVRASKLCGFEDWRLPTVRELVAVSGQSSEAAPTATTSLLPNTESGWYWSGTDTDTDRVGVTNYSRVILLPPGGRPTFYDGSYLVIAVRSENVPANPVKIDAVSNDKLLSK
jgi:hypothetical protein